MKVIVTQEDIDNGDRTQSARCPIALAISRAYGIKNIAVGMDRVTGMSKTRWLPIEAQNFVLAFDNGEPVEPFEFRLQ